jgi:signal transduction histidine kinase
MTRTEQVTIGDPDEEQSDPHTADVSPGLSQSILDALTGQIAVLDRDGFILSVNAAWNRFGRSNGVTADRSDIGSNYLKVCDSSRGACADEAADVARGIRSVLAEQDQEFAREYPCHSPTENRWFIVRVTGFGDAGRRFSVVAHENITERKQAELALTAAQAQLQETSRQAGMAEVATGVLHNLGNVLNSVNVSATLLADHIGKSPVDDVTRAVALLRDQGSRLGVFLAEDPRGPKVVDFLFKVGEEFTRQRELSLKEVAALQKSVEHIRNVVARQQDYGRVSTVAERVRIENLLEDALAIEDAAFQQHEVEVVREFDADIPLLTIEKHQVLQILVNLLRNAKDACADSSSAHKRVTVRVSHGEGHVRIQVADNGMGIRREHLNQIFGHGFTTKKDGHGFGLHSGANAAREMGGSLTADSDGPGCGAVFTLELPLASRH